MKLQTIISLCLLLSASGICPAKKMSSLNDTEVKTTTSRAYYTNGIVSYNNFMEAYFDNLTYNFGKNYKGSCGYVALGQILTFYDSSFNDNILSENLDVPSLGNTNDIISRRNSPGTNKDLLPFSDTEVQEDVTASDYFAYVEDMSSRSLHSKLLTIAEEKGYYNYSDNVNPAGSTNQQRKNVLIDYMQERGISNYVLHEKNSGTTAEIKQFIKNQIDLGRPVLISIVNTVNQGHACVAYAYDSAGNIFCNMGWDESTTRRTPESHGYYTYRNAMAIQFLGSHSHSKNFGITVGGVTNYYCYDDRNIKTIHNHSYTYSNISNTTHTYSCQCGISVVEDHHWITTTSSSNLLYIPVYECYYCGYRTTTPPELM